MKRVANGIRTEIERLKHEAANWKYKTEKKKIHDCGRPIVLIDLIKHHSHFEAILSDMQVKLIEKLTLNVNSVKNAKKNGKAFFFFLVYHNSICQSLFLS